MTSDNLDRLKQDLATVQHAAGLQAPVGSREMWFAVAFGFLGLLVVVWSLLPWTPAIAIGAKTIFSALALLVFLFVLYAATYGRRFLPPEIPAVKGREFSAFFLTVAAAGGLAILFRFWAVPLGVPVLVARGAVFFIIGVAILSYTIACRKPRTLPFAIVSIVGGLVTPMLPASMSHAVVGGMVCALSWIHAAILAIQLRRERIQEVIHVAH